MTRWARGGPANKKKPLPATPWDQMTSSHTTNDKDRSRKSNLHKTKKSKHEASSKAKKTSTDKIIAKSRTSDCGSGSALIAEGIERIKRSEEGLGREEVRVLDEVVRKAAKGEQRRLKRIKVKETAKLCFNCREPGHSMATCPKAARDTEQGAGICFKCGSTEHTASQCRVRVPEGTFPYAKCFICGETGHLSKQCPDNPRGLYPKGGCCRVCGSVEHFKRDCPDLQCQQGIESITLATLTSTVSADDEPSLHTATTTPVRRTGPKIVKF